MLFALVPYNKFWTKIKKQFKKNKKPKIKKSKLEPKHY